MTPNRAMRNPRFSFSATLQMAVPLAVLLALSAGHGVAAEQPTQKQTPPPQQPSLSLIQKLRAFLGVNPPIAIGGSRGSDAQSVCLLSPWPGQPVGVTTPVLQAAGPLNELRLEQGDQLLWQQRASSTKAIEGPVAWPIQPLKPGDVITLKVRPRGASGGDFASFTLRVADAATLQANQRQIEALGSDASAWSRALEGFGPNQGAKVAALLSSSGAPEALRQSFGCSSP
jgi:hypothetical protein